MAEFEWRKQLSVGNARLDAEHQELIKLVNDVEDAIRAKNVADLRECFNKLTVRVNAHFNSEKEFAQAVSLPYANHETEHQYVQQELHKMDREFVNRQAGWSASLAEYYSYFLSEWFQDHLITEAEQFKPILERYPYEFEPDI